mgnify:CR=1 FL=1
MPMPIELVNESSHSVDEQRIIAAAAAAMRQMNVHSDADLSIAIVDDESMADLHERWMDLSGPTDVMSFPMDELRPGASASELVTGMLGDVVIAPGFAREQARAAGRDPEVELDLLAVHGVLHLLGFDHEEPEEHAEMFALQDQILAGLAGSL